MIPRNTHMWPVTIVASSPFLLISKLAGDINICSGDIIHCGAAAATLGVKTASEGTSVEGHWRSGRIVTVCVRPTPLSKLGRRRAEFASDGAASMPS